MFPRALVVLVILLALVIPVRAQMMGPAPVSVAPVQIKAVPLSQPLVATVEPVVRSSVAAKESGRIEKRHFEEGDEVKPDRPLVELDDAILQAERKALAAALQGAEASVSQSKARYSNALRERDRLSRLMESRTTTEKEYQDAILNAEAAEWEQRVQEAQEARARAELATVDLRIERLKVNTPVHGWVARRYVEVGQWINQGDAVADVVQLDPLWVRVNVPEVLVPQIQVGDTAEVMIEALRGQSRPATIRHILPQGDVASRTFAVLLELKNPDLKVKPGFFARVVLRSSHEGELPVIPRDALVVGETGAHVAVVRDGKAVIIGVESVRSDGDRVGVRGELLPTDQVITRGNERLLGGEPVMVLPDGPSTQPAATQPVSESPAP